MIITSENSIYAYFEVISQIEPQNVLDVGMFLKRIGNLSRCAMSQTISDNLQLDGVDFFEECNLPVWKMIYDQVISQEDFMKSPSLEKYDLAILLGARGLETKVLLNELLGKLRNCTSCLFTDVDLSKDRVETRDWNCREIIVEGERFYVVVFEDK